MDNQFKMPNTSVIEAFIQRTMVNSNSNSNSNSYEYLHSPPGDPYIYVRYLRTQSPFNIIEHANQCLQQYKLANMHLNGNAP